MKKIMKKNDRKTCKFNASVVKPKIIFVNCFNLHCVPCAQEITQEQKKIRNNFYMSCTADVGN